MKSMYVAIVLAMVVILAITVVAFVAITQSMIQVHFNPVFDSMDEVEVQEAVDMWQTSGPDKVADYMHRLNSVFGGLHYLLDADGNDVLTGKNFSDLLPAAPLTKWRGMIGAQAVVAHKSQDGRYWFLATTVPKSEKVPLYHFVSTLPWKAGSFPLYEYYLLAVGVIVLSCWLAAVYFASPIRGIATGIKRFGEGDLSVRLPVRRNDEIGTLARAFNSMAERIQTLFLSEQRLLADVSHELRSPLARLHFSVKLARTAADREAALDRIKRDVDRLSILVSSLVEIARAEGSGADGAPQEVSLGELVAETICDCEVEVQANGGEIRFHRQPEIVAPGNLELLRRAVENVMRNAIRHSPEHGVIDVQVELREQTGVIAVRDYGTGLPEEFLERIFDPFFRAEEARDTDSGGVGLGLSIAKRAVQVHGGAIRARNANPGLRVEIELPSARRTGTQGETATASEVLQN